MAFGVVVVYRIACYTTNGVYGSMGHHYHSWRIASVLSRRDVVEVLLILMINMEYRAEHRGLEVICSRSQRQGRTGYSSSTTELERTTGCRSREWMVVEGPITVDTDTTARMYE